MWGRGAYNYVQGIVLVGGMGPASKGLVSEVVLEANRKNSESLSQLLQHGAEPGPISELISQCQSQLLREYGPPSMKRYTAMYSTAGSFSTLQLPLGFAVWLNRIRWRGGYHG